MRKPIIKKGDKYNFLTAIRFDHRGKYGQQFWLFKCDCGNKKVIAVEDVKRGTTKSCGCMRRELLKESATTHGMKKTPEYDAWGHMKQRCLNKKNKYYKNYGARGIKVCSRWRNSFENFFEDMGKRPKGTSIDRIDNNGNYEPNNCRWTSWKQQNNNKRSSHLLTFGGKTMTIAQWASELGINRHTLYARINNLGWSVERALTI